MLAKPLWGAGKGKRCPTPRAPSTCGRAGPKREAAALISLCRSFLTKLLSQQAQSAFVPAPAWSLHPPPAAQVAPDPSLSPSPLPQPEVFCKHKCINKLARAPMNISCLTCPRFLPVNGSLPLCLRLSEQDTFSVEHKSCSPMRWRGNHSALGFNCPRSRRSSARPGVLGTSGFPYQLLFPSLSPFPPTLFFSFSLNFPGLGIPNTFCSWSFLHWDASGRAEGLGQSCCWKKLGLRESKKEK